MELFDEVLSMAGAAAGQQEQHAGALVAIMDYLNSPQVGGITGLQKMFEQGGLGGVFSSWVSNGQNQPISANQLQDVLHSGAFEEAAQKSGIDANQLTGIMSTLLPHLVDKLTPNGQVPEGGALQSLFKGLTAGPST
jgi:uncharacterized protein YidB (DUF937 family)